MLVYQRVSVFLLSSLVTGGTPGDVELPDGRLFLRVAGRAVHPAECLDPLRLAFDEGPPALAVAFSASATGPGLRIPGGLQTQEAVQGGHDAHRQIWKNGLHLDQPTYIVRNWWRTGIITQFY